MTRHLFNVYDKLVLRRPAIWLVSLLAVMLAALWHAQDFRIDASSESLVLENDKDLQYYREVSRQYGGSEFIVITYTPKDNDLFTASRLQHLQQLQQELAAMERVSTVYSLLDVPLLFSPPVDFSDLASDYRTLLSDDVDFDLAQQEFTHENPLYRDMLASRDGNTTALLVNFERDDRYFELLNRRNELRQMQRNEGLDATLARELDKVSEQFAEYNAFTQRRSAAEIEQIRNIMDGYRDQADLFLGGVPMIATDLVSFIKSDLRTFGLGVLLFLVVTLFVIFRRPRWVIVPLVCCAVTVITVTGIIALLGWNVTVISSNYISLLLIITMSITIHLTVRFREIHAQNPDAEQKWLIKETASHMLRPSVYMILTTMVGFSSLVISGIRPVIDFGMMMTMGLAIALVVCFVTFPALLSMLKAGAPQHRRDLTQTATVAIAGFSDRYRPALIAMALLVIIASAIGISRLTVENRFIDYFKESTEIYQGMLLIDQKLGGTTPLDIIIDAPQRHRAETTAHADPFAAQAGGDSDDGSDPFADDWDNGADPFASDNGMEDGGDPFADSTPRGVNLRDAYWFTPARLQQLLDIQAYLESLPETGKVLSLATTYQVAEKINQGPLSYIQLMLLASFIPEDLRSQLVSPYLSDDGNQVRISIRVIDSDKNLNRNDLLKKIRADLGEQFDLEPGQVTLSGAMVLYNNMLQSLFDSQIKTLGYVFVAIMIMLLILFRSLPIALISMVPSMTSAALVLGLMGWIGLPLDLMTITITAITIGIAVDDTIHYIHRYHEEWPKDQDYAATVRRCHASVGKAMYYTSLTIIVGFSILALSNFNPTIYFGLLTGLAMFVALISNLTLLPAMLLTFKPKLKVGPTSNIAEESSSA